MSSRKQYLKEVQKEYLTASKTRKIELLDEIIKRTGLNRKYITRRLSAKTRWESIPRSRATRPREYGVDLIVHLVELWDIFDEPCSQRLITNIHDELDHLRDLGEIMVTSEQADKLKSMSPRTIDRLLEHEKAVRIIASKYDKKKKYPLLYQVIPTKLSDEWDRSKLGQIQIDGVEHCGASAKGEYINTISTTDISSHWWEGGAAMGKGQTRTVKAIDDNRCRFPFEWVEAHPDNGTSFINYVVWDYAKQTNLELSRSRPFKKNDNCFVEQKNSQNVRKVVGHVRYDTQRELIILNDLYRILGLYKNYFQAVLRLESKERQKGHVYRKYQKAKTPYRWLMDSNETPEEVKQKLLAQYEKLNPVELKRQIDQKLKLLAEVYKAKQSKLTKEVEEYEKIDTAKVTFSFDATSPLRLPTLVA